MWGGGGWGGGVVTLSLICLRGVQDNIISDWGLWPPPRLEGEGGKKPCSVFTFQLFHLNLRFDLNVFQLLNSFRLDNRNIRNALSIVGAAQWALKASSKNEKFKEASLSTHTAAKTANG